MGWGLNSRREISRRFVTTRHPDQLNLNLPQSIKSLDVSGAVLDDSCRALQHVSGWREA